MTNILLFITNLFAKPAVLVSSTLLEIPMADAFRTEGKIYVLLGVVLILLIGFLLYLWRVDQKVKKLEEEIYKK